MIIFLTFLTLLVNYVIFEQETEELQIAISFSGIFISIVALVYLGSTDGTKKLSILIEKTFIIIFISIWELVSLIIGINSCIKGDFITAIMALIFLMAGILMEYAQLKDLKKEERKLEL